MDVLTFWEQFDYGAATLSKLYLTIIEIIMQRFKLIGQFKHV